MNHEQRSKAKNDTTLMTVRQDRLSRNAAFLLALRGSGVRFVAVDMPEANDLSVGMMALVAQAERGDLPEDEGGAGGG